MNDRTQGPTPGQGTRTPLRLVRLLAPSAPRQKKRRHVFTKSQEDWIRTALRNARRSFGTWACLADALGVSVYGLSGTMGGKNHVSAELAVRLAFATGISLDGLLRPGVESAGRCPSCGRTREGLQ